MHIKVRETLVMSRFLTRHSRPFKAQYHVLPLLILGDLGLQSLEAGLQFLDRD